MRRGERPRALWLGRAAPLILARLVAAAISVAVPLVLARVLKLAEYGTYKQLFLVAQTLTLILPFGMAQALYFFVPRSQAPRPYCINALGFLLVAGGLAVALVAALAGPAAGWFSNPDLVQYRWTLALYVLGTVGGFPLEIALTSQGRTKAAAAAYLASDLLRAALMLLPLALGLGLPGLMAALDGFALLRLVAAAVVLVGTGPGPFWQPRGLSEQLSYSAPFGLAVLISRPAQYAHQYAVSFVTSPSAFAIYSAGCFQVPLVDLLYTPTSEVLMVEIGERDRQGRHAEAVELFRQAAARLATLFFPLSAFLFAAAPEFISAAFGPRFLAAVPIFRVSVLGIGLAALPLDGLLRARDRTRAILASYGVKALATIPMVWVGVGRYGMRGGIVAFVLGELVGKALLLSAAPGSLSTPGARVRLAQALPWSSFGRALAASACASACVPLVRAALEGRGRFLPLLGGALAFGVAYGLGALLLGLAPWRPGLSPARASASAGP